MAAWEKLSSFSGPVILVFAYLIYLTSSAFIRRQRQRAFLSRLPTLEADGLDPQTTDLDQAKLLLKKAFENHLQHGVPVRMENPFEPAQPLLLLPMKYLEELKAVPEETVSLHSFSREMFLLNISSGPQFTQQCAHVARTDLYRNLPSILPLIQATCSAELGKRIGRPSDWQAFPIYDVFGQVIARMAATTLTGPELAADDEWIRIILNVQLSSISAGMSIRSSYWRPFYWLAAYWDPLCRSLAADRLAAERMLAQPVVDRRNLAARETRSDCLAWLVDAFPARKHRDLVEDELFLAVAAVQTSMNALTNILCDLVERPQVMADLRAEIDSVIGARPSDGPNTPLTYAELMRLHKLDSFMKESQRLTPFSLVNIGRSVRRRFTFSDGLTLEPGAQIVFPAYYAHTDPARYPEPEVFRPYRFLDKDKRAPGKAAGGAAKSESFVTVTPGFLNFGIGQHACPGRHYAVLQIKTILVELLREYDVRFGGDGSRPALLARNMAIVPDPAATVELKRL